jgi:hypothetical protein
MNVIHCLLQPVGGHTAQFVDEGQCCRHTRRLRSMTEIVEMLQLGQVVTLCPVAQKSRQK